MRTKIVAAVAAVLSAAAALALPAELVVVSAKEVRPDEAAGVYYLGSCAAGYLYNGSTAALGRVAPYRILDREATRKDCYVICVPEGETIAPALFAHIGSVARLSESEVLVGLAGGIGAAALRAVDRRVELIKLEPVTPVEWRLDGEALPTAKDARIADAIATITPRDYGGYIKTLQDFKSRFTDSFGYDDARQYIFNFFAFHNLEASYFPFEFGNFVRVHYPDPRGCMFVDSSYHIVKKSTDYGATWFTIAPRGIDDVACSFWLNGETGFVAGFNNVLARTADGGYTWTTARAGPDPSLNYRAAAMCFATAAVGWLGGTTYKRGFPYGEFFVKTMDGGRTWINQRTPSGFRVRWIDVVDPKHGWAGGPDGVVYTNDGGSSWRTSNAPLWLWDFAAASPNQAWATDSEGRIYRTLDGVSWKRVDAGVSGSFWQITFADATHGWAMGDKFIRTVDGGSSWREFPRPPVTACNLLSFTDRNRGVVGYTMGQQLYRTDDGGASFVDIAANVDLYAENVIGERRGVEAPAEIVIIGGHFDSISERPLTDAPGAEDNASGAACALAAAAAFRNFSFRRTVRYVTFGGEEEGLFGSSAYAEYCARKGEKIIAFLNADMVSYDEEGGLRDDYAVAYGEHKWLFDYLKRVNSLYGTGMICERYEFKASDHGPFWDRGYAALGAIHGRVDKGSGRGYIWYHTTEDTLDKLCPELGARFVRDYAATLAHLAGVGPYFFEPSPPAGPAAGFTRPFAVYPNPYCYATSARGVNFVGLRSPATVEIYDLAGRRVAREQVAGGCDECVWRPATPEGETLAPGVYIYRVEGHEQREAGKIVIAK